MKKWKIGVIFIYVSLFFSIPLYCQQNPPQIIIVSPPPNTLVEDSIKIVVDATDPDEDIVKVEIFANDSLLATLVEKPYEFNWLDIRDGYYIVKARVHDDFGYVRFKEVPLRVGDPIIWRPYLGEPQNIPGKIEMEYFDNGGEGIAYHENDDEREGCNGSKCRPGEKVEVCGCNFAKWGGGVLVPEWQSRCKTLKRQSKID